MTATGGGGGATFEDDGRVDRGDGVGGGGGSGGGVGKKSTSAMHFDPSFRRFDTKKALLWPIPGRTFSAKSRLCFFVCVYSGGFNTIFRCTSADESVFLLG